MSANHGEKRHPATVRRRRQARQQGQVARSHDLNSAGLLLASLGLLWWLGGAIAERCAAGIVDSLSNTRLQLHHQSEAVELVWGAWGGLAIVAVPILLALMLVGVAINLSQTGWVFSPLGAAPKLNHINPLQGAQRIVSLRGLMRLAFGLVKVTTIALVAFYAVQHQRDAILGLGSLTVPALAATLFETVLGVCIWIGSALFVLALLEYGFQRWKYEQDMMMTDQELRDELKETEGDAQIAARRRQTQRQSASERVDSSGSDRTRVAS